MTVEFEIENKKYSLYFGMVATQIFAEKVINISSLDPESEEAKMRSFAYLIYGGMCNNSDRKDISRPSFEEAYDTTILILEQGEELQTRIYDTWKETKPAKAMLDKLPKPTTEEGKKKEEAENR